MIAEKQKTVKKHENHLKTHGKHTENTRKTHENHPKTHGKHTQNTWLFPEIKT